MKKRINPVESGYRKVREEVRCVNRAFELYDEWYEDEGNEAPFSAWLNAYMEKLSPHIDYSRSIDDEMICDLALKHLDDARRDATTSAAIKTRNHINQKVADEAAEKEVSHG